MRRTGRKMTGGSTGARRKSGKGRRTVRRRTQTGRRTGGWVEEDDKGRMEERKDRGYGIEG